MHARRCDNRARDVAVTRQARLVSQRAEAEAAAMVSKQVIAGEFCHHDEPNWQPLYDLVGVKLADWFMWMGASDLEDGVQVHSYKHITTRGHLHLGEDGRAFEYVPSYRYREIDRRAAIDLVFDGWEELASGPDDKDRLAVIRARAAAGPRAGVRRRRRPQLAPPGNDAAA
jgi:hypothetical protein